MKNEKLKMKMKKKYKNSEITIAKYNTNKFYQ